jgi:DNA-binding FadR family transcriptional regulator
LITPAAGRPVSTSSGLGPVRRVRLSDQAVRQLREELSSGRLRVGDKLPPEGELMRLLGVGRTTVREAVRELAHDGMLVVRQGDGTYVASVRPDRAGVADRLREARVLEIFEVRRGLELEMCRLAAQRCRAADLRRLARLVGRLEEAVVASDMAAFLTADVELHRALAASTGNDLLIELYSAFGESLRAAIGEIIRLPGVMQACLARHQHLLDAIRRRNPEDAQAIAASYLEEMDRALRAIASR